MDPRRQALANRLGLTVVPGGGSGSARVPDEVLILVALSDLDAVAQLRDDAEAHRLADAFSRAIGAYPGRILVVDEASTFDRPPGSAAATRVRAAWSTRSAPVTRFPVSETVITPGGWGTVARFLLAALAPAGSPEIRLGGIFDQDPRTGEGLYGVFVDTLARATRTRLDPSLVGTLAVPSDLAAWTGTVHLLRLLGGLPPSERTYAARARTLSKNDLVAGTRGPLGDGSLGALGARCTHDDEVVVDLAVDRLAQATARQAGIPGPGGRGSPPSLVAPGRDRYGDVAIALADAIDTARQAWQAGRRARVGWEGPRVQGWDRHGRLTPLANVATVHLVDGRHRFAVARDLGWAQVPVCVPRVQARILAAWLSPTTPPARPPAHPPGG